MPYGSSDGWCRKHLLAKWGGSYVKSLEASVKEETEHGAHYEELWRKEHVMRAKAEAELVAVDALLLRLHDGWMSGANADILDARALEIKDRVGRFLSEREAGRDSGATKGGQESERDGGTIHPSDTEAAAKSAARHVSKYCSVCNRPVCDDCEVAHSHRMAKSAARCPICPPSCPHDWAHACGCGAVHTAHWGLIDDIDD